MCADKINCPNCGELAVSGVRFCAMCGSAIPEKPLEPEKKFCTSCGNTLNPGVAFCPNCGAKAGETPVTSRQAVTASKTVESGQMPEWLDIRPTPVFISGCVAVLMILLSLVLPWVAFGPLSEKLPFSLGLVFIIFTLIGASMLVLKRRSQWVFFIIGLLGFLFCIVLMLVLPETGFKLAAGGIVNFFGNIAWFVAFVLAFVEKK